MDEQAVQESWETLKEAIYHICNKKSSQLSFEELYRTAYNLVLNKHGELLYTRVISTLREICQNICQRLIQKSELLDELLREWEEYIITVELVKDIMMYLDRNFVEPKKRQTIKQCGIRAFQEEVVSCEQISSKLTKKIIQINSKRNGSDETLLGKISRILELERSFYISILEEPLLKSTKDFYIQEAQEYILKGSCTEYVKKADTRIKQECERTRNCFHESTLPKMQNALHKIWIEDYYMTFTNMEGSGCAALFKDNNVQDAHNMYELLKKSPQTLNTIWDIMSTSIITSGEEILAENSQLCIETLMALKAKYDVFVTKAFINNGDVLISLKKAFETLLNKEPRIAFFLCSFIDEMFKKGYKGRSEGEIGDILDKVLVLFRFLRDKDVFEINYKIRLANRLLMDRAVCLEWEKLMVEKLKEECGSLFTKNMESMFYDLTQSQELMKSYAETFNANSIKVVCLTTGAWPTPKGKGGINSLILPKEIQNLCTNYNSFYCAKHQGRRLSWLWRQGTADFCMLNFSKHYELSVSSFQMIILLLFNKKKILSLDEILSLTGIPEEDLKLALMRLHANPRTKILNKIENTETFEVNLGFESKRLRIRVPLVVCKESNEESLNEVSASVVEEDREHQIEATIIRILKSRKRIEHSLLVAEVFKQLSHRFSPSAVSIKTCTERLIHRDYLERDPNTHDVYNYLA
eukprot:GHVL01007322.1.p1 GENE.GHVL01007322.1~~GHVL01007322.1.p1  ORF type:complete len:697 (+),score=98.20 GHVL01007322.1:1029-3119(+)